MKFKFPKRFYVIPIIVFSLVLLFFFFGLFWWRESSKPVSSDISQVRFVVPKGRSAVQIAGMLYKEGLIKNPLAFKFFVQITGKAKTIQAGEFRLSPNLTLAEIADALSKGPVELWVTIPEGLRREEVVERFVGGLEMTEDQADNFRKEFMDASQGREGFLFPDTYLFPRDVTADKVVETLGRNFDSKMIEFKHKLLEEDSAGGLDLKGIATLASIIERETKTNDERPIVAGILYNRLEIGMGLQVDATVQYAIASSKCKMQNAKCDNWWPVLTREDLNINSSYNSYKYKGLPPTPIANPGLSSLKAAIYPESSEYLYYLHDSDGNVHYAKTLDEHNENVRKYLGK